MEVSPRLELMVNPSCSGIKGRTLPALKRKSPVKTRVVVRKGMPSQLDQVASPSRTGSFSRSLKNDGHP